MQNGRFSSKIALHLKRVCYKVYSCENCQQQSCRAFIGLTIHAKLLVGDVPFYLCETLLLHLAPEPRPQKAYLTLSKAQKTCFMATILLLLTITRQ